MRNRRQTRRKTRRARKRGGNLKFYLYFNQDDGSRVVLANEEKELTRAETLYQPDFDFVYHPTIVYILVMYDNDAPDPAFLHWTCIAQPTGTINYPNPYIPPNPPPGERHTYTIELLSNNNSNPRDFRLWFPRLRTGFSIDEFIHRNRLQREAIQTFTCG